ncbi:MAG: DoxX family protein [Thiolinea sp.]
MKFLVGFFSLQWLRVFDFIPPLAIRLLLAPVFWVSGVQRLGLFTTETYIWYNPLTWVNTETLQASATQLDNSIISGLGAETLTLLIGGAEALGAVLLVLGFAVRWIVPALICVLLYLAYMTFGSGLAEEAGKFLWQHGYITLQHSQFEVYVTYLILLLTLFFMGAGRWFSLDWFIYRRFTRGVARKAVQSSSHRRADVDPFEIDATDEPGLSRR